MAMIVKQISGHTNTLGQTIVVTINFSLDLLRRGFNVSFSIRSSRMSSSFTCFGSFMCVLPTPTLTFIQIWPYVSLLRQTECERRRLAEEEKLCYLLFTLCSYSSCLTLCLVVAVAAAERVSNSD